MSDANTNRWWESFHVIEMADILLDRNDKQLDTTLEFFMRELNLSSGDRVFDQCCGVGSVSIPLAEKGLIVEGCDLFAPYIERANQTLSQRWKGQPEKAPKFFVADAFEFTTAEPCDAAFNWYSSFGYAADDTTNMQMLKRAFESLKPGGRYGIDIPNFPGVFRGFKEKMIQEGVSDGREVRLERTCAPDFTTGLLHQSWQWYIDGEPTTLRKSACKMYLPNQVVEMLTESGFELIQLFGNEDGDRFQMDSPRLIITARKKL